MQLYPFATLPDMGLQLSHGTDTHARKLSEDEIATLQSIYVWLCTYSSSELVPSTTTPSYSELYFVLKYFNQIQLLLRSLPNSFDHIKAEHKARFDAEIEHNAMGESCTYMGILHGNYSRLTEIIRNCAVFQEGFERCAARAAEQALPKS